MTNSVMFDREVKEQELNRLLSQHMPPSAEATRLIKCVLDFIERNVNRYEQLIASGAFYEAAFMSYNCPDNVEEYRKMLMREGARRAILYESKRK